MTWEVKKTETSVTMTDGTDSFVWPCNMGSELDYDHIAYWCGGDCQLNMEIPIGPLATFFETAYALAIKIKAEALAKKLQEVEAQADTVRSWDLDTEAKEFLKEGQVGDRVKWHSDAVEREHCSPSSGDSESNE